MAEPYQPLYLKYRPQSLADLVGQSSVAQSLKNAIEHDRIAHAYLFTGPRGCGKTSSARILAKSINCDLGKTATPCLKCTSCDEVKIGNSPSVIEIDAASNNSVDDARLLIERAPLVAQNGKHKLYIIDECHMLTTGAFNALLKTIEEPPPHVIFILATTEEHKVPHTIMSRCQRLMFRLVNQGELVAHLKKIAQIEKIEIEDDAIELIARRSGGGLRDALGLLDQAGLVAAPGKPATVKDLLTLLGAVHEDVLLQISQAVLNHDGKSALEAAHGLMMEGREPTQLALELAKHFLNLAKASYLAAAKANNADTHSLILGSASYIDGLIQQAPSFERAELAQIVEQLDKLEQNCKRSSQPALNLEVALVALCHRQDILLLHDLSARVAQIESELREGAPPPNSMQTRPAVARPATPPAAARPMEMPVQPPRPIEQTAARQAISPSAAAETRSSVAQAARPAAAQIPTAATQPAALSTSLAESKVTESPLGETRSPSAESTAAQAPAGQTNAPSTEFSQSEIAGAQTKSSAVETSTPEPPIEQTKSSSAETVGRENPVENNSPSTAESDQPADGSSLTSESLGDRTLVEPQANRIDEAPPTTPPVPEMTISTLTETDAELEGSDSPPERSASAIREPARSPATTSADVDHVALDEFWSNVKDDLHGRSVPLFSIISEHAFPLSMENNDLTIGVTLGHFQKMIEGRVDTMKAACEAVAGRPINLKVKLVDRNAATTPRPRPKAKRTSATADDGSEEADGAGAVAVASPPAVKPASRMDDAQPKVSPVHERSNAPAAGSEKANAFSSSKSENPDRSASDSGLIAEAYKLFEGPGSRRILPS